MGLWEEKDCERIQICWKVSLKKRECWPWKYPYFPVCFLNAKIGRGNAAMFHFVVFWIFTRFRSAFHSASVSKINLNQRKRLSKKDYIAPKWSKTLYLTFSQKFQIDPLMKVCGVVSAISVLKEVRYDHWTRRKLVFPPQRSVDCKN